MDFELSNVVALDEQSFYRIWIRDGKSGNKVLLGHEFRGFDRLEILKGREDSG